MGSPPERGDEAGLVARAKTDPEAFGMLFDVWHERIFHFIYRSLLNVEVAEDVTSEVFLKVLRSVRSYDPRRARFSTWIYRIATHAVCDEVRRRARQPQVKIEEIRTTDHFKKGLWEKAVGGDRLDEIEARRRLDEAIGRLRLPYRQCILLYYFEELSYKEIACVLGCATLRVKWRLHEARRRLAQLLSNWGDGS